MDAAPGSSEGDELDVLATLVDAYESRHRSMDAPSPVAAIEFRMEQQGMTRKDLERYIGSRARVSEIMTGRRPLTLPMIQRLREGLGIPADVLISKPPATEHNPRTGPGMQQRGPRSLPVRTETLAKTKHASTGI